jgi:hypothetical protein
MDINEVPEAHAILQLSSKEIRALWKALANVQNSMHPESFSGYLSITAKEADQLMLKLREALKEDRQRGQQKSRPS